MPSSTPTSNLDLSKPYRYRNGALPEVIRPSCVADSDYPLISSTSDFSRLHLADGTCPGNSQYDLILNDN